ncbi:hypothetical protein [Nodularia sp. NIES-3585]|uniref:hypothetical protein n=1 Tax=Nodularia sp. NIES-3585 TaxID=1973477 RepID=UPI000B5C75BF|nr:hypothetical protein [Nodularia sp. NIES-3585]GAX38883.1 hypothetical protein NIES3585_49350 [Nodularia sp. NIES-3585]
MINPEDSKQLRQLIKIAYNALANIQDSKQFKSIEYSPDLTLGDAVTALEYLEWELGDEAQERYNFLGDPKND